MEIYSKCTSTEFKTDIKQLCNKCPLIDIITTGINEQIILLATEKKEISTHSQFEKYISDEIVNASKSMERTFLTEKQNAQYKSDPHRQTRIKNYIWNKERIKALNNISEVKVIDTSEKEFPNYCEIGSFFAQGFLSKKGFNCYYKELEFEDMSKLSRYLKNNILKVDTSIRQYVNDTLTEKGQKNFYKKVKMMNNIIEYCKFNNIEITKSFQSKYNDLINLH